MKFCRISFAECFNNNNIIAEIQFLRLQYRMKYVIRKSIYKYTSEGLGAIINTSQKLFLACTVET